MTHTLEKLFSNPASCEERVISIQTTLTACRALGPENSGQGEMLKTRHIAAWLTACGVSNLIHLDKADTRVESGLRPNLVALIPGRQKKTLWLFGHTDVVPPGDISAWSADPWQVRRDGDFLYGRGVEDNQQAIVSMLLLAEELNARQIVPDLSLGLVFMSDEETGSAYGLRHILSVAHDMFRADDLFIVPDAGSPCGDRIEISEKGQLWIQIHIKGVQCHASTPQKGHNAFLAASAMALACHEHLHAVFADVDELFDPPHSTFVPSKHEANVPNINTVPGEDVFFMDCRLLPQVVSEEVLAQTRNLAAVVEKQYGVHVDISVVQEQKASSTSASSRVVTALKDAVMQVYGVKARAVGIGGATVAAFLREKGFPAAVWSCIENTCHAPDERSSITSTINDARVFAHILMQAHV
ncbi:MAG: M20 family metallo-hydrolase [Desulfovibrio sp.]|nr:M20 family metallo-hydrolase [Desulfovibrio sp.]